MKDILGAGITSSKHHNVENGDVQDTEMAWDDSALTITVNPMDVSISREFCYDLLINFRFV